MVNLDIQIDSKDIAKVVYSDPRHGNSFCLEGARQLYAFLQKNKKSLSGLVWTSSGSTLFCAGGNLKDYQGMTKKQSMMANRLIRKSLKELSSLQVPTSVYVHGDCYGGGVELMSCFDHVVMAPHALIGFWQRKIGLSFGWGGGERIAQRLSIKRLANLALSTNSVTASRALGMGLIDDIKTESMGEGAAYDWVLKQIQLPKAPLPFLKKIKLSQEVQFFEKIWLNKEHKQILNLFKK